MKTTKFVRIVIAAIACTALGSTSSRADMIYFDTYVIADVGGGSYWFDAKSDAANTNWNGTTFSYNMLGGTLSLKGGEVKAYRTDGGNYWDSNNTQTVNYAVYTNGGTPSFSSFQILAGGSGGTVGYEGGNDFGATNSTGSVDLGSSITSSGDNWRVAVYFSGNGSFYSMGQQFFSMSPDDNSGGNYIANVTAYYEANAGGTQAAAFTGSGSFVFDANGQTYTLDQANTFTGNTEIDAGTVALTGSLDSSSAIFIGNGGNSSDAALSLSGTTTLANSIQVNISGGSGNRDLIKADATSQTASGNIVNNRDSTINVTNAGGNLDLSGVVSGSSAVTKTGAGTLVLSGSSANTISGVLTASAGEVVFNKSANTAAVGGSVAVSSGATLTTSAANQFGNNAVDLDGTLNLGGHSQSLALYNSGTGTVNLGGATLTNNNSGTDTHGGSIAGAGNLVKAGSGTLILSASNSYTGTTTVNAGALEVQNANGLGTTAGATTVSDGAALKLWNASAMFVADDIAIAGTGVGGVDGSLYNAGGSNEVTGTLTLSANSRIGATAGTLVVDDVVGGSNVLFVGGAANNRISGALSGAGNSQSGTTTSLYKDGAGTLTLSGANSYTGDTRIVEGSVSVVSGGALGNGSSDVFVSSGASLDVDTDVTVASISETANANGGTADVGSGATLTVNQSGGTKYFGAITGSGALTKSGSGTLSLYGNGTKSGDNTISGGSLEVQGGASLAGNSTVNSGGTLDANGSLGGTVSVQSGGTLSGSGSVGATTIADGGTISPGNSPGTLSLTNGLTWSAGGNYNWQIYNASGTAGASNGWDLLAVSGGAWDITGLNSGNPFDINLWSLSGISPDVNGAATNFDNTQNYTWEILTYTSLNGTFNSNLFAINTSANNGTSGFANSLGGGTFSLAVDGDSLNLLFTAAAGPAPVPEPGTWAAAAVLAGAAGYIRWRRRKAEPRKA